MGSFYFHKNVAFNPYKGKEPFLPPLSNFIHIILHYLMIYLIAGHMGLLPT